MARKRHKSTSSALPIGNSSGLANEPTEMVLGLVGPLGTDQTKLLDMIRARLEEHGYSAHVIRISTDIIPRLAGRQHIPASPGYDRSVRLIELGNRFRSESRNNAVLATAAAARIAEIRPEPTGEVRKNAYIVSSLKHPDEVAELRMIYGRGFYLFAVHTDRTRRVEHLTKTAGFMPEDKAIELIMRDEDENLPHGQHTRDTFHRADFFLADEGNDQKLRYSVERCIDLLFGRPTLTPTFNEFAMFMAFASSLRSADLSRQIGAVVARQNQILSTGANDCPKAGGGLYWPVFTGNEVTDEPGGRDYMRGYDSNAIEKKKIVQAVAKALGNGNLSDAEVALEKTPLADITEYGRVVHAEMEALLACARTNISCADATLYCTTFPCHNCAKHVIAAGIKEVVYIEPYPKSKALEFHPDAVSADRDDACKVRFKPFIGVGPRQFFDLFSMSLSTGYPLKRKGKDGRLLKWGLGEGTPRVKMLPVCYRDFEDFATRYVAGIKRKIGKVKANAKTTT